MNWKLLTKLDPHYGDDPRDEIYRLAIVHFMEKHLFNIFGGAVLIIITIFVLFDTGPLA